MDIEKGVLSRIIHNDEITNVIDKRVKPSVFAGEHTKKVFAFITDFYQKYGQIPSVELLEEEFQDLEIPYAKEPVDYYVDKVLEKHIRNKGAQILTQNAEYLIKSPVKGLEKIKADLANLSLEAVPTRDESWLDSVEARAKRYLELKEMGGITGYTFPWEPFNEMTSGIHDKEFIAIVARPKTGKTFLLLLLAIWCWHELNMKILIISTEMSVTKIQQRLDAIHFKLPYNEFKAGLLPTLMEKRYLAGLKNLAGEKKKGLNIVEDVDGVLSVEAKIDQYKPDIVFLDGMYLLNDDRGAHSTWERVKNISNDLRKLASRKELPLIVTTQFSRGAENVDFKKVTLAQIGFADSIGQDAELVLGMFQNRDMRINREMLIRTMAYREGEPVDMTIQWDLHAMDFKLLEVDDDSEVIEDGVETEVVDY